MPLPPNATIIYKCHSKVTQTYKQLHSKFLDERIGLDLYSTLQQGIGREYALALAKYGLNIVLISRNKQELENVANEIRDNHKVDTATIVAEFTDADSIGKIVKKVKALNHEIGVVVNNVGMMGPGYNNMADMEKKAVKVEAKVYLWL